MRSSLGRLPFVWGDLNEHLRADQSPSINEPLSQSQVSSVPCC